MIVKQEIHLNRDELNDAVLNYAIAELGEFSVGLRGHQIEPNRSRVTFAYDEGGDSPSGATVAVNSMPVVEQPEGPAVRVREEEKRKDSE